MADLTINLNNVQPLLVSGTNIKTINGNSLLGSGDLTISGGGMTIGEAVSGATANRVLYVDGSGDLADSSGLTYDGSGVLTISSRVVVPTLRASGSGGLLLENVHGDDVLLLGAGSGQGATFYGGVNVAGNFTVDTNVFYVDATNNVVAISDTPVSGRKLQIKGSSVTDKLLILKSMLSQTGNHWESRHSDDTIQSKVKFNGNFVLGGDFNEFNGNNNTLITFVPNATQGLNAFAITDGGSNYLNFRREHIYTSTTLKITSYKTSPYTEILIGQNGVSIGKDGVSAASASLQVYGRSTTQVTMKVQQIHSQSVDTQQWLDYNGNVLSSIDVLGALHPASIGTLGSAQNNSIFESSSGIYYKDSGGTARILGGAGLFSGSWTNAEGDTVLVSNGHIVSVS